MGDFREIFPVSRHPLTPGCNCGKGGDPARSAHHPQCGWRVKTIPVLVPDGATGSIPLPAVEIPPQSSAPQPGAAFPGSLTRQLDDIFSELRKIERRIEQRHPTRRRRVGDSPPPAELATVGMNIHFSYNSVCVAGLVTYIYKAGEVKPDQALTGVPGAEWVDLVVFGRKSWSNATLICRDEKTRQARTWHAARPH